MQGELMRGTLARGIGGFYTAVDEQGVEYTLRCQKKFRHRRVTPLVGDEVLFTPVEGEEHGWVEEILPRRSVFVRPPVANVSLMLVVIAPEPAPDMLLVDRMLVIARMQGIQTALAVTKADLDEGMAERVAREYAGAELPVIGVSAATGEGLEEIRVLMRGEICCLTGQSGVGKSTLLNALLDLELETGEISRKIARGKNTTRRADLLIRGDLRALDTAGFSLLEFDGAMDPTTLKEWYPEFRNLEGTCRFAPCLHDREPGCAVSAASERGELSAERLTRYRALLSEVREAWRNRYD